VPQEYRDAIRTVDRVAAEVERAAAMLPGVDMGLVRRCPSFWDVLRYVYEVGAAQKRGALRDDIAQLEAGRRVLAAGPGEGAADDLVTRNSDRGAAGVADQRTDTERTMEATPENQGRFEYPGDSPWLREFLDAVATIAALDVLLFVLLDVRPVPPPSAWPEFVRRPLMSGRSRALCESAAMALDEPGRVPGPQSAEEYLARWTGRILRLRREQSSEAGEALWEGRWRDADDPVAYVGTVARNISWKADAPLVRAPRGAKPLRVVSLDAPVPGHPTGDPLGALIPPPDAELLEDEAIVEPAWERAIQLAGLTPDMIEFARARRAGIPRRAMAAHLGWSPQRAQRAEKGFWRARQWLLEALSA
jgi:hypothetical protein